MRSADGITGATVPDLTPAAHLRDSGISWIGDVPARWDVMRIKFFAQIGNGSTPSRENSLYWDEGYYPWLNSSVVNQEAVTIADQFVTADALRECHLPIVHPPAVLIGITGEGKTRGMATTLLLEATINQHLAYVKPDSALVKVGFLRRVIDSAYCYLRSESDGGGSTKGAITCDQVAELSVPVPPIIEQEAIAAFLDWKTGQIDRLIERKKQLLEKLKEKRLAVITQAVIRGIAPAAPLRDSGIPWLGKVPEHWEVVRFSFFISFQEGPGIMAADFRDEGTPLLRIRNVQAEWVDLNGSNFLDPEMVEARWSSYRCKVGDLLISCSASTGLVSEINEAAAGAIAYTGLVRLWPQREAIIKEFIRWVVSSDLFSWQVKLLQTGSTMLHFGPEHLNQMRITLPPVAEQVEIVEFLGRATARIDQLIRSNEQMIEKLIEYRSALITAATRGKIDVRKVKIPVAG